MSTYLKKATKTPETDERETQEIVERILEDVRSNGEEAYLRHYGGKFKDWDQKLILTKEEIAERGATRIGLVRCRQHAAALRVGAM